MIRVAEHLPVKTLSLAQVHDRVLADVLTDRRAKAAKAAADAMLARAAKGETLDALATSVGGTVETSTAAIRNLTLPSAELIAAGFRLPHPVPGKAPQIAIASLSADHYALVEATKIVDGDAASVDQATKDKGRKLIAQEWRGELEAHVYIDALKRQFAVKVADDRL